LSFIPVLPFLRIMGLLAAPQDLPYSKKLLLRVLLLYMISGMLVLLPGSADFFTAVILLLLDLLLLTAFLQFCLYTRNTSARFLQTFMACLGVGVVFQLLALPLMLVLNSAAEGAQTNNTLGGLFYLILVSWQVSVVAHILRHAMNLIMPLSLLLSFAYLIMVIFLSNQVVGFLASV